MMLINLSRRFLASFGKKRALVLVISVLTSLVFSVLAQAQTYRYMDDAGNIHWTDSVSEVPAKYRDQVIHPTPFPGLDMRGKSYKQALAEYKKAEKERKVEEIRKKKEEEKSNKRAAREAARKLQQEEKQRRIEERLKSRSKLDSRSSPVVAPPIKLPPGSGPSYGKLKAGEDE